MSKEDKGTGLTPLGKALSVLLILGLVGLGAWVFMNNQGSGGTQPSVPASHGGGSGSANESEGGSGSGGEAPAQLVETPSTEGITTVKEYTYVAADKLPPVKGSAGYKWDENNKVLRFSYNVWAGWLPIIAANGGTKPNPESVFAKKYGFQLEMVLMDDPVAARDAYASGEVHTLWGTADMLVLFAPSLVQDSRTAPRIVQQIDWSNGGDGIVVRSSVKSVKDLRGKTITYAQNSPSEYYVTSLLLAAGLRPSDVKTKYTATAFEAATAFVSDKSVQACASWAPDIYNIPERVAGTRILSSTADANKLIADVYAVRADFVKDHPDVVEGLVAGIFEGMDLAKQDPTTAAKAMADAFGMSQEDVMGMLGDFHTTNFAENEQFFLNAANPTNFERTWKSASYVYRELGRIDAPVPFDQVMDFSFVKRIKAKGTFAHHKDESVASYTPAAYRKVSAEAPILTQTIRISFFPNSANPYEPKRDENGLIVPGKLYDPSVDATLERVARLVGQFDRAIVVIEGHTDASMRGKVPFSAVQQLSTDRAQAIKAALIEKYKFDPDKFTVEGHGWNKPYDTESPNDHALNRRVEISVYPPEGAK